MEDDDMNEQAIDAFIARVSAARNLLDDIEDILADNMGADVESVNWAHVGDATHVLESLRGVARFVGVEKP
jgi:hypothetical protein